jgi:hypothetical protein
MPSLQALYDELEANRISIYPVDARGLTVAPVDAYQQMLMREIATATGGQAYVNGNGLAQFATRVASDGATFYTLTYRPQDVRVDNKWHHIKLAVDAPAGEHYTLQYRRGYFDDGANLAHPEPEKDGARPTRTRLLPNGSTAQLTRPPAEPILFSARVLPRTDPALDPTLTPGNPHTLEHVRRGTAIVIQYEVEPGFLALISAPQPGEPKDQAILFASVTAANERGRVLGRFADRITLTFPVSRVLDHPDRPFRFQQVVNLPRGYTSLNLLLADATSHRLGTIQLALEVPAATP